MREAEWMIIQDCNEREEEENDNPNNINTRQWTEENWKLKITGGRKSMKQGTGGNQWETMKTNEWLEL